ncbi:MAG: hypothetical protein HZA50_08990 [Planctomycetes bacterium]|nr:hypothetical protein [Planctomycetota bacterium]
MKKTLVVLAFGSLLAAYGCPTDVYEIQMEPKDRQIERVTYFHPAGQQQSSDTQPSTKPITSGLFAGRLPDDVKDGYGQYATYKTDMGTACIYIERFRGSDDIVGLIEIRLKACDLLADMTIKWAEDEFAKNKAAEKLMKYAKGPFRADLKNICMYLWLGNAMTFVATTQGANEDNKVSGPEIFARLMLYLVERGYCTQKDIPSIFSENNEESIARLILINKAGLDKDEAQAVASLEIYQDGMEKLFAVGQNKFAERLSDIIKQAKLEISEKDSHEERVKILYAITVLGSYVALAVGEPKVRCSLKTATQPLESNGLYEKEENAVKWKLRFPQMKNQLSAVAYATWAQADEKFQKEHFGSVLLAGWNLFSYCMWENSLDGQKLKVWQETIRNLKADAAPLEPLGKMRGEYKGADIILDAAGVGKKME